MIRALQVMAALTEGRVESLVHSFYEDMDREQFHFDVACFSHADGVYRAKFEELGCGIFPMPSKRHPVKSLRALVRVMKDGRYDIVHVHQDDLSFLSILAARMAGVPVRIVHSHLGKYPHSFTGKVITSITNPMMFRMANGYFACSEKAKREFYPARLQDQVYIMKNGIQSRRFRFCQAEREMIRRQYGITEEETVIGNVARITAQKDPFFLLEVFRRLHAQDPKWRLMLVGDGVLKEQLEAKAVGLGLQQAVILTGGRNDAWRYYSALDIFALPSRYEGLGISFVEAQTNGLPTFASMAVPLETKISELIEYLPTEDGAAGSGGNGAESAAELWTRRILACEGRPEDPWADDRYDISFFVQGLEKEYLKLREKNGGK